MISGHSGNFTCKNHIPVNVGVAILRKVIPADHIRKSVVAVGLWVESKVAFEKGSIRESNWFEIFLTKHFKQNFDLALDSFVR